MLTVSNYLRDHIKQRGGQLVFTSYNRVYGDQFDHSRNYSVKGRRFKLLTVMRLDYPKDPFTIINSIQSICDADLTIVGQGEFKSELTMLVNELGLTDRVQFVDAIPNNQADNE